MSGTDDGCEDRCTYTSLRIKLRAIRDRWIESNGCGFGRTVVFHIPHSGEIHETEFERCRDLISEINQGQPRVVIAEQQTHMTPQSGEIHETEFERCRDLILEINQIQP